MADSLRPSILELAHTISERSARLEGALKGKNLPLPSFAADAPTPDFIPDDEPELRGWRDEIWAATQQLHDLVSGGKTAWVDMTMLKVSIALGLKSVANRQHRCTTPGHCRPLTSTTSGNASPLKVQPVTLPFRKRVAWMRTSAAGS